MNRIYKLIFNKRTQSLDVASELATNACSQTKSVNLSETSEDLAVVGTEPALTHLPRTLRTQYKFKNFMPSAGHQSYRNYATTLQTSTLGVEHPTNHTNATESSTCLVPSVLTHALTRVTPSNLSQTLSTMGSTLAVASSMVAGLEATTVTTATADTIHGTAGSIGSVVSGQVSASTQGLVTTIKNSPNAIINWQSFNINKNEILKFVQQSQNSAVLNRVLGKQVSHILGSLQSNGHVFLINPNGIVFGKNSQVNVGGLVASTLDIKNDDFVHGRYVFNKAKDQQIATVLNQGMISVSDSGHITLIGGQVVNNGVLKAVGGTVYLLAGNSIEIADLNNPQISYKVTAKNKAVNLNTIIARNVALVGNKVLNGPSSASEFADIVGANNEQVKAKISANGQVVLFGGSEADQLQSTNQNNHQVRGKRTGLAVNNGVINVSSRQGKAGSIKILGDYVVLDQHSAIYAEGLVVSKTSKSHATNIAKTRTSSVQSAKLAKLSVTTTDTTNSATNSASTDATNDSLTDLSTLDNQANSKSASKIKVKSTSVDFASGGEVLVGGDSAGKGDVKLAQVTIIDPSSEVFIGAKGEHNLGDAGHFISWGEVSSVAGTIDASATLGNGGFIETSAKRLDVSPQLHLNLATKNAQAQAGNWLLDPYEFFIIGKEWANANHDKFEKYLTDHNIISNQGSFSTSWGNLFGSDGRSAVSYYVKLNKAYKAKYVNSWAYDDDFLNIAKGNAKSNKPASIEIQANSVVYYQARLDLGNLNTSLYANITNTKPESHKRVELINDRSSTGGNGLFVIGSVISVANGEDNKATFGLDDNSLGSVNITDSTIQGSIRYHLTKNDIDSTFTVHNSTLNLNNLVINQADIENHNTSFGSSDTGPDSFTGGETKRAIHFNISDSQIFYHNNVYIGRANDVTITNSTFTNLREDATKSSNLYIDGLDVNISKSKFFADSQKENHAVFINTVNDLNVKDSTFTVNTTTPEAIGVEFTSSSNNYIAAGKDNLPTYRVQTYAVNLQTNLNLTNVVFENQKVQDSVGGVELKTTYNPYVFSRESYINLNHVTYKLGYFGFAGNIQDNYTAVKIANSDFTHLYDFDNTIGGQSNRQIVTIENTPITIINNALDSYNFHSAQLNIANSTIKINPDGARGFALDRSLHVTGFTGRMINFNNVTIDTNNSLNIITSRIADGSLVQQASPTRNAHLNLTNTNLLSRQGDVLVDAYNDNIALNSVNIQAQQSANIIAQNSLFYNQGTINATTGLVNFTAYQNLHLDHLTINSAVGAVVLAANQSELNPSHPFGFPNNNLTIANTSFNIVEPVVADDTLTEQDGDSLANLDGNDERGYDRGYDYGYDNGYSRNVGNVRNYGYARGYGDDYDRGYGNVDSHDNILVPFDDESPYQARSLVINHDDSSSPNSQKLQLSKVLIKSNNISLNNVSSTGEDSFKVNAGDNLYISGGSHQSIQAAKILGMNAVHVKDLTINAAKNASILNLKTDGNVTVDRTDITSETGSINLVSFTDLTIANSKLKANTARVGLVSNNSIAIADSNLSAGVVLATIRQSGSFVSHNSNYTGVIYDANPTASGFVTIQGVTKQQLDAKKLAITKANLDDISFPNLDGAATDTNSDLDYTVGPNARHASSSAPLAKASAPTGEEVGVAGSGTLGNFEDGGVIGGDSSSTSDDGYYSGEYDPNADYDNLDLSDNGLADLNPATTDSSAATYTPKATNNGLVYFDGGEVAAGSGFRVASSALEVNGVKVKAAKYGVLLGSSGNISLNHSNFTLTNLDQGRGFTLSSTGLTGAKASQVNPTQISLDHVQVDSTEDTNTSYVGLIGHHLSAVNLVDSNLTTKGSIFIDPAQQINLTNAVLRSYSDQIQLGQTNDVQARGYFANHGHKYYVPTPVDGSTYFDLEQVAPNHPNAVTSAIVTEQITLNNSTLVSLIPDHNDITHVPAQSDDDGIRLISNHSLYLTNNTNLTSEANITLYAGDNPSNHDHIVLDSSVVNATRGKVEAVGSDITVNSTEISANHTVKLQATTANLTISNQSKVLAEEDDITLEATAGKVSITNHSEVSTIDPQILHKVGVSNGPSINVSAGTNVDITDSCVSATCNFSSNAKTGITISSDIKAGCNQDITTATGNINTNHAHLSAGFSPVTGQNFAESLGFSNTSLNLRTGKGMVTLTDTDIKVASKTSMSATTGLTLAHTTLTSDAVDLSAGTGTLALTKNSAITTNQSTSLSANKKVVLDHATVKAQGPKANISVQAPSLTVDSADLMASHYVNMTNSNGQDLTVVNSKVYGQAGVGISSKGNLKFSGTNLTSVNTIDLHTTKTLTLVNSNVTGNSLVNPDLGLAKPQLAADTPAQSVNLQASQQLTISSTNVSAKDLSLDTKALTVNQDSVVTTSHDLLVTTANTIKLDNALLSVGNNANLDATQELAITNHSLISSNNLTLNSDRDLLVSNASMHTTNDLAVTAKHNIVVEQYSDLNSSHDLSLNATNNLTINDHSLAIAMNNLSISATNTRLDNYSQTYSKTANAIIKSSVNTLVDHNSVVKAKQVLKVGSGHDLTIANDSNIYAAQQVEVVSGNATTIMHNSQLAGYTGDYVKTGTTTLVTDNSSIISGGVEVLDSKDTIVSKNSTLVSQDSTTINSTHNLVVDNSKIGSYKDVLINTGNKTLLTNGSSVQSINSTTINSGDTEISQGSSITSDKDVDILTNADSDILDYSHVQGIQKVNINSKGNTNIGSGSSILSSKNVTIHSGNTTTINKDSTIGAQKTAINSNVDTIISASKVVADTIDLGANVNLDISAHSVLDAKQGINTTGGKHISIDESTINAGTMISANSTDNLSVNNSNINAGKNINFSSKDKQINVNNSEVTSGCDINVVANKDTNINSSKLSAPCNSNIRSTNGNVSINHVVINTHSDHYLDKNDTEVTIGSDNGGVSINNSDLTTPDKVAIDSSTGTTISNTTIDTDKDQGSLLVVGGFTNGGGNKFNSPEIIGAKIDDPSATIAPVVNPLIPDQPSVPTVPKSTETVIIPPAIAPIRPPVVVAPVKPKYHYDNNFIYDFTPADVFSGGGNSFISSDGASAPYDGSTLPNIRVIVFVDGKEEEASEVIRRNKDRISPIIRTNLTPYDELGVHIYYSDVGLDAGNMVKPSSITVASSSDDDDDFDASCKVEVGKVLSSHGLSEANLTDLSSLSKTKLSRSEIQAIAKCMSQTGGNTNTQTPGHNYVQTTRAHSLEVEGNGTVVHHMATKLDTRADDKVRTTEHTTATEDTSASSTAITVDSKPNRYYKESYGSYVTVDKITHGVLTENHTSEVNDDSILQDSSSYNVESPNTPEDTDDYLVHNTSIR